ncbi:MAG: hypothetical protein K2O24_04470 [Muribaculaceae bacterium]|nr:hypothetical protein [Muribaculaceae bacterium]
MKEESPEALYPELDREIERSAYYDSIHENRIADLKGRLATARTDSARVALETILADAYEAYNADSAVVYMRRALNDGGNSSDSETENLRRIRLASVLAHAGRFEESRSILGNSRPSDNDTLLLEEYYATYSNLYQYLCEYATGSGVEADSIHRLEMWRERYNDSVMDIVRPESFNAMVFGAPRLARHGRISEGTAMIERHLNDYRSGSREYSILASILSYLYGEAGDHDRERKYIALSAISDIRGAVKENMSFRALATGLSADGDVERAYRYLQKSMADADFYGTSLRSVQASRMLPVVYGAYSDRQKELSRMRHRQVIWLAVTALLMTAALIAVWRLYRSSRRIGRRLATANTALEDANGALEDANAALSRASRVREEYAVMFMEYGSSVVSAMQQYHQGLKVYSASHTREALMKKISSSEMSDRALGDFYALFDRAVLDICPAFISRVGALLREDGQSVVRNGDLLNTELRILALIRLGIDDNARIAGILRCSITTVYTYRSKLRKRALRAESFESDIRTL